MSHPRKIGFSVDKKTTGTVKYEHFTSPKEMYPEIPTETEALHVRKNSFFFFLIALTI